MSIDPKKFGLSASLVNAVNEALKGGQVKLDKNHNGKLDSDDFKKLRGEETPGKGEKNNYKHEMMKSEVADGNKANFKHNMKEDEQIDELSPATLNSYKSKAAGSEKTMTDKSSTLSVPAKDRNTAAVKANQRRQGMNLATKKIGEEVVDEAAVAGNNVVADMDARKTEVQRRIAQKQASMQLAKSNKRISSPMMKEAKCTCGEDKGSKMTCETHGGSHGDKKMLKGGKEPILINPPLKEGSNLMHQLRNQLASKTK